MVNAWARCLHFSPQTHIIRNCIHGNHTTLQLKLKKKLIYNYYATIPLKIQCINKKISHQKLN
jgi:hypothetical protein